jgi:predicted SPOUT superfamily RNA methylase MTH1
LREKTSKVGLVGRAAAIFRVDEIIVYQDDMETNQKPEMELIALLLAYMETPQYLRKRLFKLTPQLQYAGILPPLRTPHHPLNRKIKNLKLGEYREGVTVSRVKEGILVDIGVERPALMRNTHLSMNKRVTVEIAEVKDHVTVEPADREEMSKYWGYKVTVKPHSFARLVQTGEFDLTIATSRYGVPFAEVANEIAEGWKKASNILVAFGAPTQGLYETVRKENLNLDEIVDFVVNTVSLQGTETIRTEEALIASLAILNMHFRF